MRKLKSDGGLTSARGGRVKAVSRTSGSADALALTRTARADEPQNTKLPLTAKTVAHPALANFGHAFVIARWQRPVWRSRKTHPFLPTGLLRFARNDDATTVSY